MIKQSLYLFRFALFEALKDPSPNMQNLLSSARDMKLGEKVPWYNLVFECLRNANIVHETLQILLTSVFFQQKPVNLLNLSNMKRHLPKWC